MILSCNSSVEERWDGSGGMLKDSSREVKGRQDGYGRPLNTSSTRLPSGKEAQVSTPRKE